MRVRSRGSLEKAFRISSDWLPNGTIQAPGYVTTFSESKSNGEYQTTQDVVTPGYRERMSKGEVIMNPLAISKTKRSTTYSDYRWGNHPAWGERRASGTLACIWSVPPVRPTWFNARVEDAQARTLLQAHSRVAQPEFQALVTVAEASKTASMLARPFGQARDLVSRIADRKLTLVKRGLTLASAFSSAWLEYRLGWKPILYDIEGIKEAYINGTVSFDKPVRVVARASDRDIVWDLPNSVTDTAHPGITNVRMKATYSHRAKVSSGVLYELRDDSLEMATARRMGLRLADVPSSLWELVPYSWIVDRFLDIETWLNAIVPKPGVSILGSWTTTLDYQLNYHQIEEAKIFVATAPATTYYQSGGTYSEEIQSISRVANPAMSPIPTANYRDLNLAQQTDHLALTIAKLVGLKTRS